MYYFGQSNSWVYWNSFPEVFAKTPPSSEPDNLKELIQLGGCSQEEAETIAEALENAVYDNRLKDFSVIEGGVELHQPSKEFFKEFLELLEELNYSYEISKTSGELLEILWS